MARRTQRRRKAVSKSSKRARPAHRGGPRTLWSVLLIVAGLLMILYGLSLGAEQAAQPSAQAVGQQPDPDWRFFKHDVQRTGQAAADGPDSAAALWIYDTGTGKAIGSSPVTSGGKIIFAGADGRVYAINANTGTLVWKYPAAEADAVGAIHGSPAASGDGWVYFGSDDGYMRAVRETDGVFAWQYPASGPSIGAIKGSPIVSGGKVYFSALDGWVYAVRNDTGAELWKTALPTPSGDNTQCAAEGGPTLNVTVLIVSGNCFNAILRASDGLLLGNDMQVVQGKTNPIAYRTTPAADPVLARIYSGGDNHYLYSEDTNLGDRWNFSTGRQIRSSPAVSKDKFAQYIFFGSDDGKLYGVKTGGGGLLRGTKLWDLDTSTPVTTSISLSNSTPAPGDTIDIIFTAQYPAINSVTIGGKAASTKGPLQWNASYAIPAASGTSSVNIVSNHELGSSFIRVLKVTVDAAAGTVAFDDLSTEAFALMTPVRSTPAVDSKNVYFAAENGTVMAVSISDGSVAWRYPSGSLIRGSPAVAGGKVYIGTQDGKLYALAQPVPEKIPPTWSNQVQGQDKVGVGGTIMLSVDLADDTALASATLSTDETGAWANWTIRHDSPVAMAGKSSTATFDWSNPTIAADTVVRWRVYFKDAAGNDGFTGIKSFTVVADLIPPVATNVSQRSDNVTFGGKNELKAVWIDDSGMIRAELLVGGEKVDEIILSGQTAWSNFTYTATSAGSVGWQIRGTDGAGNTFTTDMQNFIVLAAPGDTTPPTVGTPVSSATKIQTGQAITVRVQASDNVALARADLDVNGKTVDSIDLKGVISTQPTFSYVPPAPGPYEIKIIITDTSNNAKASPGFTLTAEAVSGMACPLPAPGPSAFGACKNGTQSRVVYACDNTAGAYKGKTESQACKEAFVPLPTAFIGLGIVLVVIGAAALLLWQKREGEKAKGKEGEEEKPAEEAPPAEEPEMPATEE